MADTEHRFRVMQKLHDDSLAPALRELLSVFERDLADVHFPDVDHQVLQRLAEQTVTAAQQVEQLRQELEAAETSLTEAQTQLVRTAELGLAYARVYAASNQELGPELGARLAALHLGPDEPTQRRRKLEVAGDTSNVRLPAKRGRKAKATTPDDPTGSATGSATGS